MKFHNRIFIQYGLLTEIEGKYEGNPKRKPQWKFVDEIEETSWPEHGILHIGKLLTNPRVVEKNII